MHFAFEQLLGGEKTAGAVPSFREPFRVRTPEEIAVIVPICESNVCGRFKGGRCMGCQTCGGGGRWIEEFVRANFNRCPLRLW